MTLVKWTPKRIRPVTNIFDDMEAWMDQIFGRHPMVTTDTDRTWTPAFAIQETEKEYIVSADLPGMEKKDVEITIEDNVLTISGERKNMFEDKEHHYSEIRYGKFYRSFQLPENVKEDSINAKFKNGVLTLNIPKVEPVKPEVKKIAIK